jgi:Transcription factor WhiB
MTTKGRQASDRLTIALLSAAARGERANCSDVETHHYWLSEFPEERNLAMRACHGCVVFEECGAAARANRELHGVWAGKDHTRLTKGQAAA